MTKQLTKEEGEMINTQTNNRMTPPNKNNK